MVLTAPRKLIRSACRHSGQSVRHEGVEDQRMGDPSGEFSVHPGSHPSGAAGVPGRAEALVKRGQ